MELFHRIDNASAILQTRGVYKQVKVFRRGDGIYAQHGAGFIRLLSNAGTSCPHVTWIGVEGEGIQSELVVKHHGKHEISGFATPKWIGGA